MATEIAIIYKVLAAVTGLVSLLILGHIKWLVELKKTIDTRLQKVEQRADALLIEQTKHKSIFVTEPRTREVFKEEVRPIKDDMSNLKDVVSEVRGVVMGVMEKVSALVTEVRIINAVRETRKDRDI